MSKNEDVLGNIDILEVQENTESELKDIKIENQVLEYEILEEISEDGEDTFKNQVSEEKTVRKKSFLRRFSDSLIFLVKYFATSACIFGVLLIVSNYSAYWNVVHSFIYAEEMEHTKKSLIESVAAASISEVVEKTQEDVDTFKQLKQEETILKYTPSMHSLSRFTTKSSEAIDLGIEITPYENRVVIPKIGKNIPLIDIKQKKVGGTQELNNIFMKELENGIIRYPGSAKPGEDGNSFIFGHSSNFPWMDGEYNDVFSLLDNVVFDDLVIVYYGQEKYTYKIRTKNIIRPGDVSVLKSNDKADNSKITLMTCWPIGTTLNRLVLTGDLISVE